MVKIGDIELGEFPLLLAPMEDVSDPPFRALCKENGADVVYTEFISSEGLIRDAAKSIIKLDIYEKERLILDRNKEKIELESKLKEVQKNLDSKQKERDKYALNDIKRQELLDAEQSKLQQIQLDHDTVVSDLENDINLSLIHI